MSKEKDCVKKKTGIKKGMESETGRRNKEGGGKKIWMGRKGREKETREEGGIGITKNRKDRNNRKNRRTKQLKRREEDMEGKVRKGEKSQKGGKWDNEERKGIGGEERYRGSPGGIGARKQGIKR